MAPLPTGTCPTCSSEREKLRPHPFYPDLSQCVNCRETHPKYAIIGVTDVKNKYKLKEEDLKGLDMKTEAKPAFVGGPDKRWFLLSDVEERVGVVEKEREVERERKEREKLVKAAEKEEARKVKVAEKEKEKKVKEAEKEKEKKVKVAEKEKEKAKGKEVVKKRSGSKKEEENVKKSGSAAAAVAKKETPGKGKRKSVSISAAKEKEEEEEAPRKRTRASKKS